MVFYHLLTITFNFDIIIIPMDYMIPYTNRENYVDGKFFFNILKIPLFQKSNIRPRLLAFIRQYEIQYILYILLSIL